jgi:hypothetical protein
VDLLYLSFSPGFNRVDGDKFGIHLTVSTVSLYSAAPKTVETVT